LSLADRIYDALTQLLTPTRYVAEVPRPTPIYGRAFEVVEALRGRPVIVIGEKPAFRGHYVAHKPVFIDGREYWEIQVGYLEYWIRLEYSVEGRRVVEWYPYFINGLPTIGTFIARRRMEELRASAVVVPIGIENIERILVPKDNILFLDEVYEGRFPLIVADPSGVLDHRGTYDLATKLHEMTRTAQVYAQIVHSLDLEVNRLRTYLTIKTYEAEKYKTLADELSRRLVNLEGTVLRLQHEIERQMKVIEYYEKSTVTLEDIVTSVINNLQETRKLVSDLVDQVRALREVVTKYMGIEFTEALKTIEERMKPLAKPVEKPAEKPAEVRYV